MSSCRLGILRSGGLACIWFTMAAICVSAAHYTYAVLHHPEYRQRDAANLRRELPRIPFAGVATDRVGTGTLARPAEQGSPESGKADGGVPEGGPFQTKVKSVGQECPTHTGNTNVKSVGQECPTHTGNTNVNGVGQELLTHTVLARASGSLLVFEPGLG